MGPTIMGLVGVLLAVLLLHGLPASASGGHAVASLSVDQMDAVIRQAGDCVVAVMAAWCHPCIEELPSLKALARRYDPQGLRMLGLSVDYAGPQAMQPIIDRLQIDFPVYWVGEAALDTYAVTRIPLLLFFREGRIVKRLEGGRSASEIDQEIAAFLNTP
jgi:thiol-disulfide isomerase/thioredoxin